MNDKLSVSIVTSDRDFLFLKKPWNDLLKKSSADCIFLSYEWLHTWWTVYYECGVRLHIITVYTATNELVGIMPLYSQIHIKYGVLKYHVLRFLGTGEPKTEAAVTSEYMDVIALPEYKHQVIDAVSDYLMKNRQYDQFIFEDTVQGSIVYSHLVPLLSTEGCSIDANENFVRYVIELPDSYDEYLASLSKKMVNQFRNRFDKLKQTGNVAIKLTENKAELEDALNTMAELHGSRWALKNESGSFTSPRFMEFHKRLLEKLLDLKKLCLFRLQVDNNDVAMGYNIFHGDTIYQYNSGTNIRDYGKYGPGIIIQMLLIEYAICGFKKVDLGKDVANTYKNQFGCTKTPMASFSIYTHTMKGRLLAIERWLRKTFGPSFRKLMNRGENKL